MSLPAANWKNLRRLLRGPLADVVPLLDADGVAHIGICFPEDWSDHKALGKMPPPGASAGVAGVAELVDADLGALVYAAQGRTLREISSILAEDGGGSLRASIELTIALVEIIDRAHSAGLGPHTGLTPWRVALSEEGHVQILGWGLSQLDVEDFLDDEEAKPSANSLRYCPPERLEDAEEDASTDRLVAGLLAMELLLGEPVHAGLFDDVLKAVEKGDAIDQLPELPEAADLAFSTMLASYPDERHASSEDCLADLRAALETADGLTLAETVKEAAEYASHEEVELTEKWVWPDGELVDEEGDTPAEDTASAGDPATTSPQTKRAIEAAERAKVAAKTAGVAADKGVELGLREVEGVDAALDEADQHADEAIGAAEEAHQAAESSRSATDEAAAEALANTATEAALAAEDAAHQAKSAADRAVELSEAHRVEMRAAFMERLDTLRAQASEGQSTALVLPKMESHPAVQAAIERLESQQEALLALASTLTSAFERAENADTTEGAEAAIAEIEATISQRGQALDEVAKAQSEVRAADAEALATQQSKMADQIQEQEQSWIAFADTTPPDPQSLPEQAKVLYTERADCFKAGQEDTQQAREALANHDFISAETLLSSSQDSLAKAQALQIEIDGVLHAWRSARQGELDQRRKSFAKELQALTPLPDELAEPLEALASLHEQRALALERARAAYLAGSKSAEDLDQESNLDVVETALDTCGTLLIEANEAQARWADAQTAYEQGVVDHEQAQQVAERRAEAHRAAEQAQNRAQDALTKACSAEEACVDVADALASTLSAQQDAKVALEVSLESLAKAAQAVEQQDELDSLQTLVDQTQEAAVHTHRCAQGLDDSTSALLEAKEGAAQTHRHEQEEALRRIERVSNTLDEVKATRTSSYEAARAATRPAGPRVADAWDEVEEAAEQFDQSAQKIVASLGSLPRSWDEIEAGGEAAHNPALADAEACLEDAKGHLQSMHEAVRSLEDAARLALADAQRITAAREAGAALLVELQSLSVGDAPRLDDAPMTPAVEEASQQHQNALAQASALQQAAEEAAGLVAQAKQPGEAEQGLEQAREALAQAREAAERARNAASTLGQVVEQEKNQQQMLASAKDRADQALAVLADTALDLAPLSGDADRFPDLAPLAEQLRDTKEAFEGARETLEQEVKHAQSCDEADLAEEASQAAVRTARRLEESSRAYAEAHHALQSALQGSMQAAEVALQSLKDLAEHCAQRITQAAQMTEQIQSQVRDLDASVNQDALGDLVGELAQTSSLAEGLAHDVAQTREQVSTGGAPTNLDDVLSSYGTRKDALVLPSDTQVQEVLSRLQTDLDREKARTALEEAAAQTPDLSRIQAIQTQASTLQCGSDTVDALQQQSQKVLDLMQALDALGAEPLSDEQAASVPAQVTQILTSLQEIYPALEKALEQAIDADSQRQQAATQARQQLQALADQTPTEPETSQLLEEVARFLPHMTERVATACAGHTSARASFLVAVATDQTEPEALNQVIASASGMLSQLKEALGVIEEVRVLVSEARSQASQEHQTRLTALTEQLDTWTQARAQARMPAPMAGLPEVLLEVVNHGMGSLEALDNCLVPLENLRSQWTEADHGSTDGQVSPLLEKASAAVVALGQAQAQIQEAFSSTARKQTATLRAKPIPEQVELGQDASEALQSAGQTFEDARVTLSRVQQELTETLEALSHTPDAETWAAMEVCCEQLNHAHGAASDAKQQVEECFRGESSPTERLRRRRARLEHLAEQEAAPAPRTAPAEVSPRRRSRRSDGEASDGAPARRRRRNDAGEGAPQAAPTEGSTEQAGRRRTRSQEEGSSNAADRSTRLERLRARRAEQRDQESDRPRRRRETSEDAAPRRRRRRRSDGDKTDEDPSENSAPPRRRRMRDRIQESTDDEHSD